MNHPVSIYKLFNVVIPVGKIAEKTVCRNAFLTIWHCILSGEFTKTGLLKIKLG